MSSRLIPPNDGASASTRSTISLVSRESMHTGTASQDAAVRQAMAESAAMEQVFRSLQPDERALTGKTAGVVADLEDRLAQVDAALNGEVASDPILPALADTVRGYRIPRRHFQELLDGTEMDQTTRRKMDLKFFLPGAAQSLPGKIDCFQRYVTTRQEKYH